MKTVAFVIDVLAVILVIALVAPIHKKNRLFQLHYSFSQIKSFHTKTGL